MHNSPKDHENIENEENKQEESLKASQQAAQEAFNEEAPEIAIADQMLQIVLAVSWLPVSDRLELRQTFNRVNNPNFTYKLLDVHDNEAFLDAKRDLTLVGREMDKHVKKGKDYAQVGNSIFKTRISLMDYKRKDQAVQISGAIHKKLTALEIKEKFKKAIDVSGLTDQELIKEFKGGFSDWLKKNPGGSIDQYITTTGRNFFYSQLDITRTGDSSKRITERNVSSQQREEWKKRQRELYGKNGENLHVRTKLLKDYRGMLTSGREEILKRLGNDSQLLTDEELKKRIQQIVKGEPQPVSVQKVGEKAQAPGVTPTAQPPPLTQAVQKAVYKPPQFIENIQNKIAYLRNRILGRFSFIQNAIDNAKSKVISRLVKSGIGKKILTSSAATAVKGLFSLLKIGGSIGLKGAITGLTGGLGLVLFIPDLINPKTIKIFFLLFIGIVGLIIIIPIFFLSNSTPFLTQTFGSPKKAAINNRVYSWNDFEKDNLINEENLKKDWVSFEIRNLIPQEKYFTLKDRQ